MNCRECKIEGLTLIRRLAKHHTDTLLVQIKQVTHAVIAEVSYVIIIVIIYKLINA